VTLRGRPEGVALRGDSEGTAQSPSPTRYAKRDSETVKGWKR